jgi:hypothetical protein
MSAASIHCHSSLKDYTNVADNYSQVESFDENNKESGGSVVSVAFSRKHKSTDSEEASLVARW